MESEKALYLKNWEREFQTTLKVLKAYPHDKQDLKPAEKLKTAKELAWLFANEEKGLFAGIIAGELDWSNMKPAPDTIGKAIELYEEYHNENVEAFKKLPPESLKKTLKFFVAPRTEGDVPKMELLWMMLMDQIHHRGQFSVYLRIAGAKVPSIYGPTADEPWN
ncbi:MAG: DinB family protein [Candidatus Woesearchaeota archaeon]